MFRPKFRIPWFITSVVAIPVLYFIAATVLLREVNANIAFAEKELVGLREYNEVLSLYFDLYASNDAAKIAVHISKAAQLSPYTAWKHIEKSIEASRETPASSTEIAVILGHEIQTIGDDSNLILDPVLNSYYLVDSLFNQIPLFLIWSTGAKSQNKPMPEAVAHYSARLDHVLQIIAISADNPQLENAIKAIKNDWAIVGVQSQNVSLQHVHNLANTAIVVLNSLLNQRLQQLKQRRLTIIGIIILFYFVMTALIVMALRNYVSKREVILAKERKKLISQLAQKNDELEKFAYAAAHDLKEPIRTMRCFATLLKNESGSDMKPSAIEYVAVIENTAQRAEQMINDLLGYTQVGEIPLTLKPCDCGQELEAVLEDLKSVIEPVNPQIIVSAMPVIDTVPSMFRRVMINLLENAIKYRRLNTSLVINISATRLDDYWQFSIEDNGIGIASEYAESVFEPFKRLESGLDQEGNGIGLTSCKKIIERLGGKIWIVSEVNQGTAVYFLLPIHTAH